jgi:hypothetical protein
MDDCSQAQAVELIRALHGQLHEMSTQLAWLQSQELAATNGRASEMRRDAAALRRDIQEAQGHIDRLQRRYLGAPHSAERDRSSSSALADLLPGSA